MKTTTAIAMLLAMSIGGCGDSGGAKVSGQEKQMQASDEYERGPHRGRMLRSGDLAVEVTIYEEGVEPEFHVYTYLKDKPLDPKSVDLSMTLSRLGGRKDKFSFTPDRDFLKGSGVVREPHSFDVEVAATHAGASHAWSYASYEGRTTIEEDAASAAGVKTEAAGPATIDVNIDLPGRVILQPQGRAEIKAWYPGRVTELTKTIGQSVVQGEPLARIEASDSLRNYTINAPINGVVSERTANVGDVATQALYVITDVTKLFATFYAFPQDAQAIRVGQPIRVKGLGDQQSESSVALVLPTADPTTQTMSVQSNLANAQGAWRPGMMVEGTITVSRNAVPLAVRTRALQRFRDFTVVFAKVGDTYEVRMLKLGRRTSEWTEVTSGLDPGEVYVTDNAFLIRADIEKSGASHDH